MSYFEMEARMLRHRGTSIEAIAKILRRSKASIERALKGEYVVRVVFGYIGDDVLYFLESLPSLSRLVVHSPTCYDILPPYNQYSASWADDLAEKLDGLGFNAVRAPRWPEE